MFLCSAGSEIKIIHYIEKSKHVFWELYEVPWKNVMDLSKILKTKNETCSWFLSNSRDVFKPFLPLEGWEWIHLEAWQPTLSVGSGYIWLFQMFVFIQDSSYLDLYLVYCFSINRIHPYVRCHIYITIV